MKYFWLGTWIWIAGVPLFGMLALAILRRGPNVKGLEHTKLFKRLREDHENIPDETHQIVALLIGIFWPGVLVLVAALWLLAGLVSRELQQMTPEKREALKKTLKRPKS